MLGFTSLVHSVRFLWRTPGTWSLAAVPVLIHTALSVAAVTLAVLYAPRLIDGPIAPFTVWLTEHVGAWGVGMLRWLLSAALAVFGLVTALWLTPPLSAPALERLILMRERDLGVAPRVGVGLWREFVCALTAQLVGLALIAPVWFVLWSLTLLLPSLAPVTVPLKFLAFAWLMAFSLLDYPLSLRGMPMRERFSLMRRGLFAVFGFGAAMSMLFAIPFLGLFVLPIAVVAATELAVALE